MAKYRLLDQDELKNLEKEFVDYLVLNGIDAEEWERIKKEDKDKARSITDLFSDVVFEKILRDVKYLEIYEKNSVRSFACGKSEIKMITMEVENDDNVDFTDPKFIASSMNNPPDGLLIYDTEKPYSEQREIEIFQMIEKGCMISEGKLHQALEFALENE